MGAYALSDTFGLENFGVGYMTGEALELCHIEKTSKEASLNCFTGYRWLITSTLLADESETGKRATRSRPPQLVIQRPSPVTPISRHGVNPQAQLVKRFSTGFGHLLHQMHGRHAETRASGDGELAVIGKSSTRLFSLPTRLLLFSLL